RAGGPSVAHLPVRPVCAGRTGRGLRATAHHSATVGGPARPLPVPCALLIRTGETIPQTGNGAPPRAGRPPAGPAAHRPDAVPGAVFRATAAPGGTGPQDLRGHRCQWGRIPFPHGCP